MDEKIIEKAKNDLRVKFNYLINDKINTFSAIPRDNMNKIIIYCHGLGANKIWATRFYDYLLTNKIGIISFDFPGHGEDKTDFVYFNLSLCISYLEEMIDYVKIKYNVYHLIILIVMNLCLCIIILKYIKMLILNLKMAIMLLKIMSFKMFQ